MSAKALKRKKNKLLKLLQPKYGESFEEAAIVALVQSAPKLCSTRHELIHRFSPRAIRGRWHVLHHMILKNASLESIKAVYDVYPEAMHQASLMIPQAHCSIVARPLHFAMLAIDVWSTAQTKREAVRFLLEKDPKAAMIRSEMGGKLNMTTARNGLPIHLAIFHGADHGIIEDLLDMDPKMLDHSDDLAMLPLHYLCQRFRPSYANLIRRCIDMFPDAIYRVVMHHNMLPLALLCSSSVQPATLDIIQHVYEAKPDAVDTPDSNGFYPLHHACTNLCKNNDVAILFLLDKYPEAAKMATKTWNKSLPLHLLCGDYSTAKESTIHKFLEAFPEAARTENERKLTPLIKYLKSSGTKRHRSVAEALRKAHPIELSHELQAAYDALMSSSENSDEDGNGSSNRSSKRGSTSDNADGGSIAGGVCHEGMESPPKKPKAG